MSKFKSSFSRDLNHVTITFNPKVGNSKISNYSSKVEQAVEKLVWQQKIGIVKVRSTGESKHTTSKGCQNTKKFFFIVMEQFFLYRKMFLRTISIPNWTLTKKFLKQF